ncbi:MAG: hypothetical protein IJZ39_02100 [Oscillospiraceae bacterium]|nr:hypothetical protein [Oscillospiraceae bacterium]
MKEFLTKFFELLFPDGYDPYSMISFLGFVIAVVFIAAVLIRIVHQKASRYNHALASAMALLFAYTTLMWLHGGILNDLVAEVLRVLPLIEYDGEKITLFKFALDKPFDASAAYLYTFILSFILIGLDDLIPDAKNGFGWIALQVFITFLTLVFYWFVIKCLNHFMPDGLNQFAPLILVAILVFMVLLGFLKVVLGLVLVAVNPLLGAVSAFFSTSRLGQALGKAALCALFLCAVSIYLVNNDLGSFVLSDMTFAVCILPMAVLVGLWFVVGNVL